MYWDEATMVYDDNATIAFEVAHTSPKRQVFLGPCQPESPSDIQLVAGIVMVVISMVRNLMVRNQFPKTILNEGVVGFGTLKQDLAHHLPRFAQRQYGLHCLRIRGRPKDPADYERKLALLLVPFLSPNPIQALLACISHPT